MTHLCTHGQPCPLVTAWALQEGVSGSPQNPGAAGGRCGRVRLSCRAGVSGTGRAGLLLQPDCPGVGAAFLRLLEEPGALGVACPLQQREDTALISLFEHSKPWSSTALSYSEVSTGMPEHRCLPAGPAALGSAGAGGALGPRRKGPSRLSPDQVQVSARSRRAPSNSASHATWLPREIMYLHWPLSPPETLCPGPPSSAPTTAHAMGTCGHRQELWWT